MSRPPRGRAIVFLTELELMEFDSGRFVLRLADVMSAVGYNTAVLNVGRGVPRPNWLVPPYLIVPTTQMAQACVARLGERLHIPASWRLAYSFAGDLIEHATPLWLLVEDPWIEHAQDITEARLALRSYRLGPVLTRSASTAAALGSIGVSDITVLPPALERSFLEAEVTESDGRTVIMYSDPSVPKADAAAVEGFRIAKTSCPDLALSGFGYGERPTSLAGASYTQLPWHDDDSRARLDAYAGGLCFVWTRAYDPVSLPVLEAMAAGCPVVTSRSAEDDPFCVDGENCLLAERNDPNALSAAILRVADDEALRSRLIAGGRRTASGLTWERLLDALPEGIRQEQRPEGARGLGAITWE
jgi:hypothetical protein